MMVEEWKARRKEWKKKRWKKGKREKVVLGKVLLFLFDCVFASSLFSLHPPHSPHHNTHSHTHPPHNTAHWCTLSNVNRAVCCAAFLRADSKTHCIIHTTLHHMTTRNTHRQTQHRHSSLRKQRDDNHQ